MKPIEFSELIVGTMRLGQWGAQFDKKAYENFIDGSIDLNLCDFDHADIYGGYTTEVEFGEVLKQRPDLRNKVQITTKCGIQYPSDNRPELSTNHYDFSKKHIIKSVDNSLENLHIENIKLLLLHRPDYLMEPEEVDDSLHYYMNESVSLTAWSPLGGGKMFTDDKYAELNTCVESMAEKYNCSPSQILYAWIYRHPAGIIPVTGTSRISRVKEALEAKKISLSREDWYLLLEKSRGHRVA